MSNPSTVSPLLRDADIPPGVKEVLVRLRDAGFEVYLVGGCVRDLLLGTRPKDFDVATSALPEQVQKLFRKVIPTGIQHGTVTVLTSGGPVEVTTFRSEGSYVDGRRPQSVEFHQDIREDLARRDFTINAMAFDPLGSRLVDPFGGERDLAAQTLRCVGAALERFGEDGLRPMRAVRFAAVLGFALEASTRAAIPQTLGVFRKVARERIREELTKLLLSDRPALGVSLLAETGLLADVLPEAADAAENSLAVRCAALAAAPKWLEVRLSALLRGAPAVGAAMRRLTFPTKTQALVELLLQNPLPLDASDADLRRFLARVQPENLDAVLALATATQGPVALEPHLRRVQAIRDARPALSAKDLALDGGAVMTVLGVGPSRIVGEATRFLVEQVLEHPELNTASFLADLLRTWSASRGP